MRSTRGPEARRGVWPAAQIRPRGGVLAAERGGYGARVKVATWNVNGIRARVGAVAEWLARHEPDVLCLQETKVVDDDFPYEEFTRAGYAVTVAGQASYNGVAIASRHPLSDVSVGLRDDPTEADKRAISATVLGLRVVNVYVPNGKSVELPSFVE